MAMIIENGKAAVLFGSGDIAICPMSEIGGDRQYLAIFQTDEGAVGDADDVGREFPAKEGMLPDELGTRITLEFDTERGIDVLIGALNGLRETQFTSKEGE